MRLCKYCNKPIAEKDIWNPDNDGNGYHHQCLVDMEFKARDKQIYDKGKIDVLDKIRAEITEYKDDKIIHLERNEMIDIVLGIIDKYREGEEDHGHTERD
jgi:hypothetical protein